LLGVVAERLYDRALLAVGPFLDRRSQRLTLGRERFSVDEPAVAEPNDRGVDLLGAPPARGHVGVHGQAPPELGEQRDLDGVDAVRDPRRHMRVASVLAEDVGRPPDVAHARRAAAEVPGHVREPELLVRLLGLGREVDVGGEGLDEVAHPAADRTHLLVTDHVLSSPRRGPCAGTAPGPGPAPTRGSGAGGAEPRERRPAWPANAVAS